MEYTGSAITQSYTVTDSVPSANTTLTLNTHYTEVWSNNTNAGTATLTLTGKGNYTGTKVAQFEIEVPIPALENVPLNIQVTSLAPSAVSVNSGNSNIGGLNDNKAQNVNLLANSENTVAVGGNSSTSGDVIIPKYVILTILRYRSFLDCLFCKINRKQLKPFDLSCF